ncbi:MAG TPA: SAM hydroxide adenosyltransferase [Candidatus Saccharimonadales bacterium]|nr:SAM hydroxide adenosyltransferase [Candidatus Saccharimonadales bacterium]
MQFVTIINDCNSQNDFGRQATRIFRLFGSVPVITVGIQFGGTFEAAGNLIDMLDASDGEAGAILVNAAPRHGQAKKWPNGTPFGYFHYKKTLIVSTIDGYCLSLAKKIGILDDVYVTDLPTVIDEVIKQGQLPEDHRDFIVRTQFRSYEYMPRVAKWVSDGLTIPSEKYPLENIADIPKAVWLVDGFGNCKTTILPEEVGHEAGKMLKTKIGEFMCYERLKDVPNGEPAIIVGSSGFGKKRFLEVVVQGKSAAEKFNLVSGSEIF